MLYVKYFSEKKVIISDFVNDYIIETQFSFDLDIIEKILDFEVEE